MKLLLLIGRFVNLYTQLAHQHVASQSTSGLTVPPTEARATPSETGSTANLGLGKLMSKEVERDRDAESR
jgi:hypothetical protein